jgi:uncharacterized protein (TIGR02452 family)
MTPFIAGITTGNVIGGMIAGKILKNRPFSGLLLGLVNSVIYADSIIGKKVKERINAREIAQKVKTPPAAEQTPTTNPLYTPERLKKIIETNIRNAARADCKKLKVTAARTTATSINEINLEEIASEEHDTIVEIVQKDYLSIAQEHVKDGQKVAVAIVGQRSQPGGLFNEGQRKYKEEDLCYRSTYCVVMDDQLQKLKNNNESSLYPIHNRVLHSPEIQVLRDEKYNKLGDDFSIGVITSTAPFQPRLLLDDTHKPTEYETPVEKEQLEALLKAQLYVASQNGYDILILDAFGSDHFGNPPNLVAKLYRELLESTFKGVFKNVIFAITDEFTTKGEHNPKGNFKPFYDCFKDWKS